ncbi:MAG: hypoxanthine-guanine phosphoribosyltransferase [Betaproteobacteria bacterium]|nr:hypoxanthine-guanine phosphoribosyltransferase [Betaproteobacteria bacterium]
MLSPDEAWRILHSAERLVRAAEIDATLQRLAGEIAARIADRTPLVLTVMGGAVVFSGHLLPLLAFPLELDYVHVTRYGDTTRGGSLEWKVRPRIPVQGRTVLVLDDILDEGITLAAIRDGLVAEGAKDVHCAVFADKSIGRSKPIAADFVGITLPNRYVFGFGMDVHGAWRNLPEIYALSESNRL